MGAELLNALKGYPAPEIAYRAPPSNGSFLYLSTDGRASLSGGTGVTLGSVSSTSRLMWGGQGTVSRLGTWLNSRPNMSVEFMVASGDSGYIANLALTSGSDRIDFDDIRTINAWDSIPLDREVYTWRKSWGSGSALVSLIVQSIDDGRPTGFRVCWLTQYGALNRLACTVYGRDYGVFVIDDYFGSVQRTISTLGVVPWIANPPAGVPAPAPSPNPLRYVTGWAVTDLLRFPLPVSSDPAGANVSLRDASGSSGTLNARALALQSNPSGAIYSTTLSSNVGGQRGASVSYETASTSYPPYVIPVSALTLSYAGQTLAFPGQWQIDPLGYYPLDNALLEARNGSSIARLILQSVDGVRNAYRLCWLTQHQSLNRLSCGVGGLPGTTGFMIDDYFGSVRTFR